MQKEKNIRELKKIVPIANRKDLLVEGELDYITGISKYNNTNVKSVQKSGSYTNPIEARDFIEKTKIDVMQVSYNWIN